MIKLIATDLDGTIINSKGECDSSVKEAVSLARQEGIRFAICSGRPISSYQSLLPLWGLENECDYLVGSGGGEVLEISTGKYIQSYVLEKELLLEIIDLYEPLGIIPTLYGKDGYLYVQELTEQTRIMCERVNIEPRVGDIRTMIGGAEIKEMFVVEPKDMEKVERFYQEHKDDRYVGFKTAYDLFEFNHPLLAKDVGLRIIGNLMQINEEEMIAFGDTTNDIEMLEYVKYGIVTANGTDDAKKIAYAITNSVDENGFAQYINKHIVKR
ncbi:MAG: HAD family phosphatase [Solobacterium sp.]|nr:HAD family phosphatase [Solobacterium sp.]